METLSTDPEFWNQFAGSSSANLITIVGLGFIWGLKKLCERKSKCKSHVHCCCLDLDVRDETLRQSPLPADDDTGSPV